MNDVKSLLKKADELLKSGHEQEMIAVLKQAKDLANGDDYALIQILNDLSGAYRNCGFYNEALAEVDLALDLLAKVGLLDSTHHAITLINKANILRQKQEYPEAKYNFEKAKTILEKSGSKDYSYVSLCNNYALLYKSIGSHEEALRLQREAIEILKNIPEHRLQLATSYNNLYASLVLLKKYDEAEVALKKAEEIYREMLGVKHPLYAALLNNLADLNVRRGERALALKLYSLSLEIVRDAYGSESEAYLTIKANIDTLSRESSTAREDNLKSRLNNTCNSSESSLNTSHKKGLDRSRNFYYEEVEPLLRANYPEILSKASIGLAGTGSECLGYDDETSTDHDFDTRLIICLSNDIFEDYNEALKELFKGTYGKVLLTSTGAFYSSYIGYPNGPMTTAQWRKVPEDCFRTALNGEFFINNNIEFADIRRRLLAHYPEDVRLKKIAFCLNKMAQSGQYNFKRVLGRGDEVAAGLALAEFVSYYIRLIHLLNKVYAPFYKWAYRSMCELSLLPKNAKQDLGALSSSRLSNDEKSTLIEDMCLNIISLLKEQGLSNSNADFLTYQANEVVKNINDPALRAEDTWIE